MKIGKLGLLLKPLKAIKEVKEGSEVIVKQIQAKVIFIYNNRTRTVKATITPDYQEVIPNGINIRVENKHSYIDDNTNLPVYFVDLDNVATINFKEKIKVESIDKAFERIEMLEGELVETIDVREYRCEGARILNKRAYDIGRTSLLKFLDTPSRMEALFILVSSFLVGIITGIILFITLGGVTSFIAK